MPLCRVVDTSISYLVGRYIYSYLQDSITTIYNNGAGQYCILVLWVWLDLDGLMMLSGKTWFAIYCIF